MKLYISEWWIMPIFRKICFWLPLAMIASLSEVPSSVAAGSIDSISGVYAAGRSDSIEYCFRSILNIQKSIDCVVKFQIICINKTDHSDISESECARQTTDKLRTTGINQDKILAKLGEEYSDYATQSKLITDLHASITCRWPKLAFKTGSDIGKLIGECRFNALISEIYNKQQLIEYTQQNR